ncbi:bifunctional pyr operon transcriptional regulator/uracil phosphoribosyltransferase PyrR [bacterium]|nr:MAG: bifunctional pyr operon transcriptional regulator/uracil phosphoribosyltransferase PyrR [bacterium]
MMEFRNKATILDQREMERAIVRVAHEILERNHGTDNLVLVGIQRRGVTIARRVAEAMSRIEDAEIPFGTLDITFYRDDLSTLGPAPSVGKTDLPFDINGKTIVLVDDVLYTGRTVRAAMNELMDYGRAHSIQLAVLVDRGHRELPIRADFVGKNLPTSSREVVKVMVQEFDGQEQVILAELEQGDEG